MRPDSHHGRTEGFLSELRFSRVGADTIRVTARYDSACFRTEIFGEYGLTAPRGLMRTVPERRAALLAGRLIAAIAARELGMAAQDIPIGRDRAPVWPAGLTGSISHADGRAVCLVSTDVSRSCGIDLERIADGPALVAICEDCLTPLERNLLAESTDVPPEVTATVIFSAKEAIFKALYPLVGRVFGFEHAEAQCFVPGQPIPFLLTEGLGPALPRGFALAVSYEFAADHVLTWLRVDRPAG